MGGDARPSSAETSDTAEGAPIVDVWHIQSQCSHVLALLDQSFSVLNLKKSTMHDQGLETSAYYGTCMSEIDMAMKSQLEGEEDDDRRAFEKLFDETVENCWNDSLPKSDKLAAFGSQWVTREDLLTLTNESTGHVHNPPTDYLEYNGNPGRLNDQVLNFYFLLINERSRTSDGHVLVTNTFFWEKLTNKELKGCGPTGKVLERWTSPNPDAKETLMKTIESISGEQASGRWRKLIVPINDKNSHWRCGVVDFAKEEFLLYDPFFRVTAEKPTNAAAVGDFADLMAPFINKAWGHLDCTQWKQSIPPDVPTQSDTYSCGVFVAQYVNTVCKGGQSYDFSMGAMESIRKTMTFELRTLKVAD